MMKLARFDGFVRQQNWQPNSMNFHIVSARSHKYLQSSSSLEYTDVCSEAAAAAAAARPKDVMLCSVCVHLRVHP